MQSVEGKELQKPRSLWLRFLVGLLLLGIGGLVLLDRHSTDNPAARPTDQLNRREWQDRHEKLVERSRKGDAEVVFLGDSLTHGWEGVGAKVWKKVFEPLKAINLGVGTDQTGHLLWRITTGKELEGVDPRVAVLLIGTNNMNHHTPEQIAGGVQAILAELHKQKPNMKVLLLGIFPRGDGPDDKYRDKIKDCNALLARLHDDKRVFFLDIGDRFRDKDGSISDKIMPDSLHLSERGYEIWAEAITPTLEKLLK